MRSTSVASSRSAGFTLAEVLIISPLIVLVVAVIVAAMVNMTGNALQTRERNHLVYSAQEGLNQIEADIRLSRGVVLGTGELVSGQGSDSNFTGTAEFETSASTLVLEQNTTNKSPLDLDRDLLYYSSPNPCSSQLKRTNPALRHKIVFFLDDNTLKRRTIVDFASGEICDPESSGTISSVNHPAVWQRNTCSTTNTGRCFSLDTIIAKDVESVEFEYYPSAASSTPTTPAITSSSIRVTIHSSKSAAGEDVTHSASLRATVIR